MSTNGVQAKPMGLPLVKLGFLAVKQVAKPVAARVKSHAKGHPVFQSYMARLGAFLHKNSVQIDRMADGKEQLTPTAMRLLLAKQNEAAAVEKGSDFLAEVVIYGISAGVLGFEYVMSKRKEEKKAAEEARVREANEELQWQEFKQLNTRVANLQSAVLELVREREEQQQRRRWWGGGSTASADTVGQRLPELNPPWGRAPARAPTNGEAH